MKIQVPKFLIFLRLFLGIVILILSFLKIDYYETFSVVLFTIGLLTDFFDGIIARRLELSTVGLRRLDSAVDQFFFIFVAAATFIQCPQFFFSHKVELILLFGFEGLAYLVCFIKFRKEVATHAIASKAWTLVLFATMIEIMTTCHSGALFQVCFYLGLLTRLEIIGIILILKHWTNDVPGLYQAILLRKGKPIKRHKLLNG